MLLPQSPIEFFAQGLHYLGLLRRVLLVILTDLIHSIKTTPNKKPGQVNDVAGFFD
jgi:hypothetical protein